MSLESGNTRKEARKAMRPRVQITSGDRGINLKQYIPADAPQAFGLIERNKDHLSQFDDPTGTKYASAEEFRESIVHPTNPDKLRLGIWTDDDTLVGSVNLTEADGEPELGSIGYYLGAEHEGHGYATRAVEAVTDYAFEDLGYDIVQGTVHKDNIGSASVMHGAGYQFEIQISDDWVIFSKEKPQE